MLLLLLIVLVQQFLQELRVLVPDVRRRGGASRVAAIVGAVMMMGQYVTYSVHFTKRTMRVLHANNDSDICRRGSGRSSSRAVHRRRGERNLRKNGVK